MALCAPTSMLLLGVIAHLSRNPLQSVHLSQRMMSTLEQ